MERKRSSSAQDASEGKSKGPKVLTESEINALTEEIQKKNLDDIKCEILPNKSEDISSISD